MKETSLPLNDKIFKVDVDMPKLKSEEAVNFHTFVMKGMFLVKRVRPDEEPRTGF